MQEKKESPHLIEEMYGFTTMRLDIKRGRNPWGDSKTLMIAVQDNIQKYFF